MYQSIDSVKRMAATRAHESILNLIFDTIINILFVLKNKLANYGYFHANSTGYYGKITAHAVKAFQRDYGLHADGVAGPRTLAAMGIY